MCTNRYTPLQDRMENAKTILQKQSVVSITADSWQRKSNQSVMGVVVHHCPEDQEQPTKTVMKSTIIGLEEITEEHTAVNLAKYFQYTKTNKWVRAGNYLLSETRNVTYPQYAKVTDEEGREAVIKCISDMKWGEDMPEEEENTDIEHADEEEDDVFVSFAENNTISRLFEVCQPAQVELSSLDDVFAEIQEASTSSHHAKALNALILTVNSNLGDPSKNELSASIADRMRFCFSWALLVVECLAPGYGAQH
ncbi:hypothetical protein FOL47_007365 [Perkinsus chesapeaki]|uniref:Uncharacterized protein n=1 Tax=Perkinsus chesapeaki TaxID=330153 RepID=A0A7J6LL15_PERCH|nr:hypothetical protein FOL47_007365 [Perkinsus chesapeaki]